MKKTTLITLCLLIASKLTLAQEWYTNFDVAKRMALVQDKMLFVLWEDALDQEYPISFKGDNGNTVIVDLSLNDDIDPIIWEHFIPVFLPEASYEELYNSIKDKRKLKYINKFNDDTIKIMDVNGNILNIDIPLEKSFDLSFIIKRYSLNTNFLNQEFRNYLNKENFVTSINLASKYMDYAIFAEKPLRKELLKLSSIYVDEAKLHLEKENPDNKEALLQRLDLYSIKELLILNKPKRALRILKKIPPSTIASNNEAMFNFLNYTTFKLLENEDEALRLKDNLSSVNLKKAELIFNINK